MLYRFKSQATADLIMLEANARQLLEIMGRPVEPKGIITVAQIGPAVAALEKAIADEALRQQHSQEEGAAEDSVDEEARKSIGLHQRATPLIRMLERAQAHSKDVVWGV